PGDPGDMGDPGNMGTPGGMGDPGAAGTDGLSCWDLDGDGIQDGDEDINTDGSWDALDCQGAEGVEGPAGPSVPITLANVYRNNGGASVPAGEIATATVQC